MGLSTCFMGAEGFALCDPGSYPLVRSRETQEKGCDPEFMMDVFHAKHLKVETIILVFSNLSLRKASLSFASGLSREDQFSCRQ